MTVPIRGVKCPRCQDVIWSRSRHDFRYCRCEYTFVDGGRDYLRYGAGDPFSSELTFGMPVEVEITPEFVEHTGRFPSGDEPVSGANGDGDAD